MVNRAARSSSSARRHWPLWVMGSVILLGVGVSVGWALVSVLSPAEEGLESTSFTYVAVTPGEVGSSINLNTVAEWTSEPVGVNRASGIVTEVSVAAGDEVSPGAILYSVNLRPIVIAQGEVPAFRAISLNTAGPDVTQLQNMLTALRFYSGAADGDAGSGTISAIKAWQRSLGLPQSGIVELGDVIFVPSLPTRVTLDSEIIASGATVSGGEDVVSALPQAPMFTVPVTEAQAGMMPMGTLVEITGPEGALWKGYARNQTADKETGTITITLQGADGSVICGEECALIPVTGEVLLASRVVTLERVEGLVVPSAALVTDADGQTAVIDEDGERIPVTMVASARGMSVIEGVVAGTRVRVPAAETP